MAVTILIPTALRVFAGVQAEVTVEGDTAGRAIEAFADKFPDIRQHLFDENNALRSFVNVYIGEKNIKTVNGLDTPVRDGDALMLVPAIAGGTGAI